MTMLSINYNLTENNTIMKRLIVKYFISEYKKFLSRSLREHNNRSRQSYITYACKAIKILDLFYLSLYKSI